MVYSNRPDLEDDIRNIIRRKARQLVGQYGFTGSDAEDLEQELLVDLTNRIHKYNSNKATLKTFVSRIVDHKIANIVRHRKQQKRDYRRNECSIDDRVSDEEGEAVLRGQTLSHDGRRPHIQGNANQQDLSIDLSDAIESLSAESRELFDLLLTCSISEAARELGIRRSTLYNKRLPKLRTALAEKNLDEYI